MKKTVLLFFAFFLFHQIFSQTIQGNQEVIQVPVDQSGNTFNALMKRPDDYNSTSLKYPLLVFLHGMGEAGNDLSLIYNSSWAGGPAYFIAQGTFPSSFVNPADGQTYKYIILSPQAPYFSTSAQQLDYIINYMVNTYRVDTNRIYITGLSAGGVGVNSYVHHAGMSPTHKVAAYVPMSAASDVNDPAQMGGAVVVADSIRAWGFGSDPQDWWGTVTHTIIDNINVVGPGFGRFTNYPGGHCCWNNFYTPTYHETINGVSMNIYEWMLQFSRAGNKSIAVLGSSSAAGVGASTYDSSWVGRLQLYYRNNINDNVDTVIHNLAVPGTVTYNAMPTSFVPPPARPFPNPLSNVTAALNTNPDVVLINFPSNDVANGYSNSEILSNLQVMYDSVVLYAHKKCYVSTTQPRNLSDPQRQQLKDLRDSILNRFGQYALNFWDDVAAADYTILPQYSAGDGIHLNDAGHKKLFDRVVGANIFSVVAANQLPVVNAGTAQTITQPANSATLNGSANDPDGTITSHTWSFVSGPVTPVIANPGNYSTSVTGLAGVGTYIFKLTAVDNSGGSANSTVNITVNSQTGLSPYGGTPRAIPGTIQAEDYDNGGQNVAYLDLTSGNSGGAYRNDDVDVQSTSDVAGGYNVGWTLNTEWLKYSVNVTSSGNYTLQLRIASPNNSASISASMDSINLGTVSIPSTGGWQTWQTVSLNNISLSQGLHVLKISFSTSSSSDPNAGVNLNYLGFVLQNLPPVANAGADQTITLPTDSVTLSGSGTDADDTIASYQWTKISGPSQYNIVSPGQAQTLVKNLVQGVYQFELTVTDNLGATGKDTVVITVNAANQPPIVNAGSSQTITQPASSVTLNGSATDPDGTIASHNWSFVSGPVTPTIVNPANYSTNVTGLTAIGTYIFKLTATDNLGASASNNDTVIVNAANIPPVANAGADQTIQLPINTITLNGSGTDADGTVSSYQWTKIAGPAQFTIVTPTLAQTVVTNLVQGVYQFQLTVTDNQGATGKDTVIVTVNAANIPPIVTTQALQNITQPANSATLNGNATDPDGTIASHTWSFVSGPATPTIVNPTNYLTSVSGLNAVGTYIFSLTAVDNNGASSSRNDTVIVNPQAVVQCSGVAHHINPTVGLSYYRPDNTSGEIFSPGDTMYIDYNKNFSMIELHGFHGTPTCPIVICNYGGQAVIGNPDGNITDISKGVRLYDCSYIKFTGSGFPGIKYGFKIQDYPSNLAYVGQWGIDVRGISHNIEIDSVEIRNCTLGIQIQQDPQCDTLQNAPYNVYDSMSIHDNFIHKIWNQGMYLGTTNPDNFPPPAPFGFTPRPVICGTDTFYYKPPRGGHFKIWNNIVDSTGRPGIQMGAISEDNGSEVWNNIVKHNGLNNDPAQASGIVIGSYTHAYIHNNTVVNTLGMGIASFNGSSNTVKIRVENNYVDSSGYLRPFILPGGQFLYDTISNTNNTFSGAYCVYIRAGLLGVPDSTMFTVLNNQLGKNTGNGGGSIGFLDEYNWMAKAPGKNLVCGNTNIYDGNPVFPNVEGTIPVYFSTNCSNTLSPYGNAPAQIPGTIQIENYDFGGQGVAYNDVTPGNSGYVYRFDDVDVQTTLDAGGGYNVGWVLNGEWLKYTVNVNFTGPYSIQARVASMVTNSSISLYMDSTLIATIAVPFTGNFQTWQTVTINNIQLTQGQHVLKVLFNTSSNSDPFYGSNFNYVVFNLINQSPIANAGADQVISLPANTVTLTGSGTDSDGTIASYQWTKISGPSQYTIVSPTQAQTQVSNLVQGTYQFELKVTDNQGGTGRDTVTVMVNQPPVANAGYDLNILLPVNSTTLTGSGTDIDGNIVSYQWTKVSGPSQYNIVSPNQAQTVVNNLVLGTYKFELIVTDNYGAIGKDTMTLTVFDIAPPPNQPPVVNAGPDQLISLPVNSVIVNGSAIDNDGTIVSYQWTKISGPSQYTILFPGQPQTVINNLVAGVYQFELKAIDNLGLPGRDTIMVTVNQPPLVNAGPNQTLLLPVNSTVLNGSSTDADGTITSYQWTKIAGPYQYNIATPTQPQTVINNLVTGVYQFELSATDNNGAIGKDTVMILVDAAPTVNAGPDQLITLPANTVTLNGSGADADGTIFSYQWTKISGPSQYSILFPTQPQTLVNNMVMGVYKFELKVTDNLGATSSDTVTVIVNQPPIVDAGPNQILYAPVNSTSLNGTASDADGTVVSYQWTKIFGPSQYTIVSPTQPQTVINNLVIGTYQFELRVTDNYGAIGRDTVTIAVNPAPNIPPVANAGADQTITLPANTVTLTGSGTDADGTIAAYQWTKIVGPSQYTIVSPTQAQTVVNNLVQGVYLFELRVTDNQGAVGRDTVAITVNAGPVNQPPVANAGPDQTIILPANSVNLNGTGVDADGTIISYQWSKISGPTQFTIASPLQAQTVVNNLVQGVYKFELRVTDNLGAVGRDTISITVLVSTQPPIVSAGNDKTITLPVDSVTVSSNTVDPFGVIVSYQWRKVAGPSQFLITTPGQPQTLIKNLVQGTYQFEITVTDSRGASAKDTIAVNVNEDPRRISTAKIFPNPASSIINVGINSVTSSNKTMIKIYNEQGIIFYQEEFMRTQQIMTKSIDVSKFPKGIYFVRIGLDINNTQTIEFIKE